MKKTVLGLMAILAIALVSFTTISCDSSSDDDFSSNPSIDIIGKWYLREARGTTNSDDSYAVFSANQTYEVFPKGNLYGFSDKGSWKVVDDELVLNNRTHLTIVKLTSTALVLKGDDLTMKFQRDGEAFSPIVKQLAGKWLEREYEFIGEGYDTYTGNDRYLQLNLDYTFVVKPVELFEDEFRFGPFTWSVEGSNILVLKDKNGSSKYRILKISSKTLQLGWLEDGKVIEKTTFEKEQ